MRNNDIVPRFSSIGVGKLGGATAKFPCGIGFGLYVFSINLFLHFSFAHINRILCFYNEVRFIAFRTVSPINIELVGHRT